jgi:hypothetical protein
VERLVAGRLSGSNRRMFRSAGRLVGEVQNLDRLAAGQRHTLDVRLLSVLAAIHDALPASDIGTQPKVLKPESRTECAVFAG